MHIIIIIIIHSVVKHAEFTEVFVPQLWTIVFLFPSVHLGKVEQDTVFTWHGHPLLFQTKVRTDKCSPARPLNLEIPPRSATVQEKHEFLERCIGNFVDKYALVVPDVKGLWEMEEAQRVESEQVSNHMQSQTSQNLYRPGNKLLKLYCCSWQQREIFFH